MAFAAMCRRLRNGIFFALLISSPVFAEAERDLRDAVTALARTSHSWETTTRQRFKGETAQPQPNPNAPVEVRGRFDPNAFTLITLEPSRQLPVAITALWRAGLVVAETPGGWMHRSEIRQTANAATEVTFGGEKVRLSRVVSAALKVTAMRPLSEELLDLVADLKSCRREQGLILGELPERVVEKLWLEADARRAPEIHGTVIFKIGDQGVSEYHVVIGIGFPNSRTKKVAWTTQQWSTRIMGVGTTAVDPPAEAVRALER